MNFKTRTTALLLILAFTACKKHRSEKSPDETKGEENLITYDGNSYSIKKGREWTYKLSRYPSHTSFAYYMWNGTAFSPSGGYELGPGDPPISLFFFLSLPASSGYMDGDFVYQPLPADWYINGLPNSVKDKQLFTDATVAFDANNDRQISTDEVIKVTGGVINYHGNSNIQFDLTLENGKKLTGRIKADVVTTNPSA